jgi:hypothetical protein
LLVAEIRRRDKRLITAKRSGDGGRYHGEEPRRSMAQEYNLESLQTLAAGGYNAAWNLRG